ncbi:MAG: oligosaccharide flippase family protein [Bacteroidetes bacterium]|nr:oligosaccharide flippase family protein [Bacteroidota bacterium]
MIRRIVTLLRTPEGVSTFSNLLSSAFGLMSFFFLTRSFSPNELGQWFIFLSGATLTDMLRIGLVNKGFVYLYSGNDTKTQQSVTGSGLALFTLFSAVIALLLLFTSFAVPVMTANDSSWRLFFLWYPWFAVASIPHNVSEWIAQAELKFNRSIVIKVVIRGGFLSVTGYNYIVHSLSIEDMVLIFILFNAAASFWTLAAAWTPLSSLRHMTKAMVKELFRFGKFNSLTQVGANLLRSSDSFFLGSVLGPAAVALYAVPAKLLEVVELPLRSFGAAAYPEFSRLHRAGDMEGMKRSFVKNTFRLTVFVLPFLILCGIFAEQVTVLFGGEQYRHATAILYFFLAYCLLIPFDRFSGIFIDSLNKPQYNTVKVWIMLAVNIISDAVALFFFGTVESVAAASLITFGVGTIVNMTMIRSITGWNPVSRMTFIDSFRLLVLSIKGSR